jgi:ATP-dependent DNA ligase
VQREGERVRLFTRNGHDWSDRLPRIVRGRSAQSHVVVRARRRAVLLGTDGRSDFDALHSRKRDAEVQFHAFDCLVTEGDDLRRLPLSLRKSELARRVDAIFLSDFEQGEIGPDLCRHACLPGPGGLVPKHRESLYRSVRSAPGHPAFARMMERFWG